MAPRDAVRVLAVSRIAIGVAVMLAPRTTMGMWVGRDASSDGAAVMGRALGIRDAVFGGMLLHTLSSPQVAQRWTATCGACDTFDGLASVAVRDGLPPVRGPLGTLLAFGSGAAHLALSRQLDATPAAPSA